MYNFNIYSEKLAAGVVGAAIGTFTQHLLPLIVCVLVFEGVDFATGCWKSAVEAKRKGERFAFESVKAWRTIYKLVFIMIGIVLAEMLDATIADARLRFANIFTAFACGVEFWSFLENAAVISDHPIFRWLRKFMKKRVEKELDTDIDEITKDNGHDKQEL